jgi:hypothetical protein
MRFRPNEGAKDEKVVGLVGGKKMFPEEYAVSGWFKYVVPTEEVFGRIKGMGFV